MTDAFVVTIFHNPACSTSRNTLAMIEAAGYAPQVIDYLQAGWTRRGLEDLVALTGLSLRDLLRVSGTPAADLGLVEAPVADDLLLDAMIANPILVNRPIVVTPKGAKLCRPSEVVFDLLERRPDRFEKEDSEVVSLDRRP